MSYKNQVTAWYKMRNLLTGTEHGYFIHRNTQTTREEIISKFYQDLAAFPAYQKGIFVLSSDIFVEDYRGYDVDIIDKKSLTAKQL